MKKNLIIVVLLVIVCVLAIIAVHATNMSKSLMADSVNYRIMQKDVKEYGIYLYEALSYNGYGERLLRSGGISICDDVRCVHVDKNGDLFASDFYNGF